MRSALLTGLCQLTIKDTPAPAELAPDQVLLRMRSVGVCGSDVHYYSTGRIGGQVVEYPFTVGHEGAAVVERVGTSVAGVKPGDRVAVEPAVVCYQCDQCLAGRENTCRNLQFLGCPGQLEGCLSEFIVMPEKCCLPIPDSMTFTEAALVEPLAIGLYAARLAKLTPGARIGIFGLGPIGLSVMLCVKNEESAKVYGVDPLDYRCRAAAEHGADWTGNPLENDVVRQISEAEPLLLDIVFECCGRQEALDMSLRLLKPGGRLMIIGIPEFERYSFQADTARRHEICLQHVRRQNRCTEETIDLVAKGDINPNFMATHHFSLEETPKAFEMVEGYRDHVIKAMVDFSG